MWPQQPPLPQSTATSGPGSCCLFALRRDGRIKRCATWCRRRSKSFLRELSNIIANPCRAIVSAKKQCVLGFTQPARKYERRLVRGFRLQESAGGGAAGNQTSFGHCRK